MLYEPRRSSASEGNCTGYLEAVRLLTTPSKNS